MVRSRFKILSFVKKSLKKSLKKLPQKYFSPLALLFILLGFFFIAFPSFYRGELFQLKEETPLVEEPIKIDPGLLGTKKPSEPPLRIVISSVKIDLPVVEAKVVKGYWETSATSASHGVGSANPGERGNMVIFAHARKGLFLPLKEVKVGDLVEVFTKERRYRYQVAEIKEVKPEQVEVISQTPDERLTLYTCSGFLDSKRLVVVAKPITD